MEEGGLRFPGEQWLFIVCAVILGGAVVQCFTGNIVAEKNYNLRFPRLNNAARSLSLLLYVVTTGYVVLFAESNRQVLVFAASFTFQTNTLGMLSLALRDRLGDEGHSILQRLVVVWGVFMAFMWWGFLAGKEGTRGEVLLNHVLHYYQPMLWVAVWLARRPPRFWTETRWLYIPTAASAAFIYCLGHFYLGYHIYPVFTGMQLALEIPHVITNSVVGLLYVAYLEFMGSVIGASSCASWSSHGAWTG
jgi:hypothetical protein